MDCRAGTAEGQESENQTPQAAQNGDEREQDDPHKSNYTVSTSPCKVLFLKIYAGCDWTCRRMAQLNPAKNSSVKVLHGANGQKVEYPRSLIFGAEEGRSVANASARKTTALTRRIALRVCRDIVLANSVTSGLRFGI